MHLFYYVSFLFMVVITKSAVITAPSLRRNRNYKKMFKTGVNYWTFRLYMEDLRARDSVTHHVLLVLPNLCWILMAVVLLMHYLGS
jgi:hypothetical protein